MGNIGFDLGTTTSCVCVFNLERQAFDYLRFDGKTLDFFPTMLTYRLNRDGEQERLVGYEARRWMHSKGAKSYRNFKLALENGSAIRGESCEKIAMEFIGTTLGKYVNAYGKAPERIVFTVPDQWKRGSVNPALLRLRNLFRNMGFDVDRQIVFESEPVSAAAYYCYEVCGGTYTGNLLVVDYGGGTLDLTLCRVKDSHTIEVLQTGGFTGEDAEGCAGETFDEEATRRVLERYGENIKTESVLFSRWKNAFEQSKISSSEQLGAKMRAYYQANTPEERMAAGEKEAFSIMRSVEDYDMEYSVLVSDIAETFERVNAPALERAIREILRYCAEEGIDTENRRTFRVILAGGFSNLYSVEAKVRQLFGSLPGQPDERFDYGINRVSRSTAVAHGAGIIAEDKVRFLYRCPKDYGFYFYDSFSEQEKRAVLLKKGDSLNAQEPVYHTQRLYERFLSQNATLRYFTGNLAAGMETSSQVPLNDICPITGNPDNWYQLGVFLGMDFVPLLYAMGQSGEYKIKSLEFYSR